MSGPPRNRLRLYVLTASVAAITATGAWYGAGLKSRQEFNQERRAIVEAPLVDRIEQLEQARARLVRSRDELQSKIDHLATRSQTTSSENKG